MKGLSIAEKSFVNISGVPSSSSADLLTISKRNAVRNRKDSIADWIMCRVVSLSRVVEIWYYVIFLFLWTSIVHTIRCLGCDADGKRRPIEPRRGKKYFHWIYNKPHTTPLFFLLFIRNWEGRVEVWMSMKWNTPGGRCGDTLVQLILRASLHRSVTPSARQPDSHLHIPLNRSSQIIPSLSSSAMSRLLLSNI